MLISNATNILALNQFIEKGKAYLSETILVQFTEEWITQKKIKHKELFLSCLRDENFDTAMISEYKDRCTHYAYF